MSSHSNLSEKQLLEELKRSKKNEEILMEQNREYKKRLTGYLTTESSHKRLQQKVDRLEGQLLNKDSDIKKLEANLKAESVLKNQLERKYEEETFELRKVCQNEKRKYELEIVVREQRERQLESLTSTKLEVKKLTATIAEKNQQLQELMVYNKQVTREKEELTKDLKDKVTEVRDLKKDNKIIENQLDDLHIKENKQIADHERLNALQKAYGDKEEQFRAEKQRNYKLLTNVQSLKDEKRLLLCQIEKQKGKILDMQIKNEEFTEQKSLLQSQLEQLTSDGKTNSSRTEKLQKDLKEKTMQNHRLEDREKMLNSMLHEAEAQINKLLKEKTEAEVTIAKSLKKIAVLKEELKLLNEKLSKAEVAVGQSESKIIELNDTITLQGGKINTLDKNLGKSERRNESKRQELENLKMLLNQANEVSKSVEADRFREQVLANKQLTKLEDAIEALIRERDLNKEEIRQLQEKVQHLQLVESELHREKQELDEQVTFLRCRASQLFTSSIKKDIKLTYLNWKCGLRPRRWRVRENRNLPRTCRQEVLRYCRTDLESKDEEIRRLKAMLARRPEDAAMKLHLSRWRSRKLHEDGMAFQAKATAYQEEWKKLKEENDCLNLQVRKLMREVKRPLPPIEKKDKAKKTREKPSRLSHSHLKRSESNSQVSSPGSNFNVICEGSQIRPRRLPPLYHNETP